MAQFFDGSGTASPWPNSGPTTSQGACAHHEVEAADRFSLKPEEGRYSVRLLTPRECARLMGADEFHISAPLNQALFGFGDAVCVPVVEWIAEAYLNPVVNELARAKT